MNTFHPPSGEATITLEVVAYIYGLPIDGEPFSGLIYSKSIKMQQVYRKLLGLVSTNGDRNFVQEETKNTSKQHDQRVARAFLFCLVSNQLLNNSFGSQG